ncbi:MAG: Smr/MutS family protein [Deltaproteobacteria bacterium]|nr:Smr/MutS family protein [Deltaproteobacteria bacterium]
MPLLEEYLEVSPATLQALEFPSVLSMLAQLAATDLGARRLQHLRPMRCPQALETQRNRYEEGQRLLAFGTLIPSFEEPLGEASSRLFSGHGATLGTDLTLLASLLRLSREALQKIQTADPPCSALLELGEPLEDISDLERKISRTLDRRGEVRPDASPELVRLRGQIQGLRDGLYQQLRDYVQQNRELLSEETIPLRGGRLLLTLQSGSRGRLGGLTHGRSGSGRSFYFEPLDAVEPNNRLQQSSEEETAERARILRELLSEVRLRSSELQAHLAFLGELDTLQAKVRFGELGSGRLAEVGSGQKLRLLEARHPLLDPAFADLREVALGQAGHLSPVTPLGLSLAPEHRVMVVTGPNAGGKTVALKTTGVLVLCTLCGLPIPAAKGSVVPILSGLVATVGDEQDLLTDRSTFSGRLLRLKEVWDLAGPESLVLLDELGSGTDPAEGAALAVSLVETLLERGALCLVTSHLVQVAASAMELEGASCAAMEFDAQSGAPTFHLVPGPPGGSEAISLGRRLGLPPEWLDRAEAKLTEEHRDLRRVLTEAERLRQEVAETRSRLEAEVADATLLRERLTTQEVELRKERKSLAARMRGEVETFRHEVLLKLRGEVSSLSREFARGRRKGLEREAVERLFSEAPLASDQEQLPESHGPLEVGKSVQHRTLRWVGTLQKLDRGRAEVQVRGKSLRCREEELMLAPQGDGADRRPKTSRDRQPTRDAEPQGTREINLIGQRVEPALEQLERFLDQALLASLSEVRIIHGHGSGRLRSAVREHLRRHPAVGTVRPGGDREGGNGATLVGLGD